MASALTQAQFSGWEGLVADQRAYLDDFWTSADVVVEGDAELQQAVRFSLFHLLQAGARAERRAIPSKGLTGPGYDGHTFWDTEMYVLPVLTYTSPTPPRMPCGGGTPPWTGPAPGPPSSSSRVRLSRGAPSEARSARATGRPARRASTSMPTSRQPWSATARPPVTSAFENDVGLELLVDIARLFMSLGHHDALGGWHIDGVTGPDEYSAIADDNVYTNLMAARALVAAADMSLRHPARARELSVTTEESAMWRGAAAAVHVPYDEEHQVHEQSSGFTRHAEWDFEGRRDYPLLLHAPYFDLYRKQVIKQADTVLAMHWCGDHFTPDEKARNFDYYERRTVRDSSLSACTQAVLAAELGHLDLAYDYAYEAALTDLLDLQRNSVNGLHMASLGGAWLALVAGFGGFRDHSGVPSFDPVLPEGLTRLRFSLLWRGIRLTVDVEQHQVTYSIQDDAPSTLLVKHRDEEIHITAHEPAVHRLLPRSPLLPAPEPPPGREPMSARRPIDN